MAHRRPSPASNFLVYLVHTTPPISVSLSPFCSFFLLFVSLKPDSPLSLRLCLLSEPPPRPDGRPSPYSTPGGVQLLSACSALGSRNRRSISSRGTCRFCCLSGRRRPFPGRDKRIGGPACSELRRLRRGGASPAWRLRFSSLPCSLLQSYISSPLRMMP